MEPTRTYTIILEPAEEGGFIVSVPSLPEVATCGDTEDEALANAREAIELVLEHRLARGEDIPDEREPQVRKVTVAVPAAA
jgi:antitoxin HicB